ncbi:MAG: hypothetical protein J6T95_01250 [Oscillospiraceae bacterium]|nr:hypothetical protein [Oscillospiraceae bacterium]
MKRAIIGERYSRYPGKALESLGFDLILLPDNALLDKRTASHPDMSVLKISPDILYLSGFYKDTDFERSLKEYFSDIRYPEGKQGSAYPSDSLLNVGIVGKYFIYNPASADKKLVNDLRTLSYTGIPVKQGYTNCSVRAVSDNALITSDPSIYKACSSEGLDILYIDKPVASLEGFDYGFIGGSSIRLSDTDIAFTGQIADEEIRAKIDVFLQKYGKNAVFLTEKVLFDIGSAIVF